MTVEAGYRDGDRVEEEYEKEEYVDGGGVLVSYGWDNLSAS